MHVLLLSLSLSLSLSLARVQGPQLAAAHEAGMLVIVKEALANGRLTERADEPRVRELLVTEASALGTTADVRPRRGALKPLSLGA